LKENLDFKTAKEKVSRPESFNHVTPLKNRILQKPYKKSVIFVDNSGADIILGILPFVRYLLKSGTHVILAANTYPSVNDVTVTLDIYLLNI
jgi:type II pantothenate kinase